MHKNIFGLFLIWVSFLTFSMDSGSITLRFIDNKSNFLHVGTIMPGEKLVLQPNEKIDLNVPLLSLSQNQKFPIVVKIEFDPPSTDLPEVFCREAVYLTLYKSGILKVENFALLGTNKHYMQPNKKYILNVSIDKNNDLTYELK